MHDSVRQTKQNKKNVSNSERKSTIYTSRASRNNSYNFPLLFLFCSFLILIVVQNKNPIEEQSSQTRLSLSLLKTTTKEKKKNYKNKMKFMCEIPSTA